MPERPKRETRHYSPLDDDDLIKDVLSDSPQTPPPATPRPSPAPVPARAVSQEPESAKVLELPRQESPEPIPAPVVRPGEALNRVLNLPEPELRNFNRVKTALEEVLGLTLDNSNIGRALVAQFITYEDVILEVARETSSIGPRPSNHNRIAMAEFDEAVQRIFATAWKRRLRRSA